MEEGTYLEDFVSSVELLPNDIRRDFDLMRDLDREAHELERELAAAELEYLERSRARKAENKPIIMPILEPLLDIHKTHQSNDAAQAQGRGGGFRVGSVDMDGPVGNIPGAISLTSPGGHGSPGGNNKNNSFPSSSSSSASEKKKEKDITGSGGESKPTAAALATASSGLVADAARDPEGAAMLAEIYDLRARVRSRLNQKSSTAINLSLVIGKFQSKLNSDIAFFETSLRSCGDFERASGAQPGSDVAIRPSISSDEMILGKVIVYYADIGAYDVADVDNSKRYHLPEALVTVLDIGELTHKRLSKGELIYAVYPETTAFYLGSVSQAPRRAANGQEPTLAVQFQGDSDENGVTPVRVVALKHVFRAMV